MADWRARLTQGVKNIEENNKKAGNVSVVQKKTVTAKDLIKPKEQSSKVRENTLTKTVSLAQEKMKERAKTNPYMLNPVEKSFGDTAATKRELEKRNKALEDTQKKITNTENCLKGLAQDIQNGKFSARGQESAKALYTKLYNEYKNNIDFYNKTAEEADKLYNHYISRTEGSLVRANTYAYQIKELEEELTQIEKKINKKIYINENGELVLAGNDLEARKEQIGAEIAELKKKEETEWKGNYDYTLVKPGVTDEEIADAYVKYYGYGKSTESAREHYKEDKYGQGNIDLTKRPVYETEDGIVETVNSISFSENGKEILIPTIIEGEDGKVKKLTEKEAIEHYKKTGEYLGKFNTIEEANEYANNLHYEQALYYAYGDRDNILEWVWKNINAGASYFEKGIAATLDFILPTEFMGRYDFISQWNTHADKNVELWTEEAQKSGLSRGKGWKVAGDVLAAAIAALPNAVLAIATGGTSLVATGATALGATATTASTTTALLGQTIRTMMKNPSYWASVVQTLGTDYEEAKARGANDVVAAATAILTTAINAGIEVGSGIEQLPKNLKSGDGGLKDAIYKAVKSAFEEGGEEVLQKITTNAMAKMMYDKDAPILSVTDETAVINPAELAKDFGMGVAVGGLMGAVPVINSQIEVAKKTAKTGKFWNDPKNPEIVKGIIDSGLESPKDSLAYKLAEKASKKDGKLSNFEIGKLYKANVEQVRTEEKISNDDFNAEIEEKSTEAKVVPAEGIFDKSIGTRVNPATSEDINKYVDYAYRYAEETKGQETPTFPKQRQNIVIGKAEDRLVNDIINSYGEDLSNAHHVLNDNDIRHIKNSHGEDTNETYPVTAEDIKRIPDIIKNYDDVLLVEREDGKKGIYYVKRHNGVTYYLEEIKGNNKILSNKQMLKVPTGTIPDIKGLKDAINKKWNINSAPDDKRVPQMYVQDVRSYVPDNMIPQEEGAVKTDGANYADVPIENDFSAEVMRQLTGGKVIKGDVENEQHGRNAEQVSEEQGREQGQASAKEARSTLHMREGGRLDILGKRKRAGHISESVRRRGKSGEQRKVSTERILASTEEDFISAEYLGVTNGVSDATLKVYPRHAWDSEAIAKEKWALEHGAQEVTYVIGEIRITKNGRETTVDAVYENGKLIVRADSIYTSLSENVEHEMGHLLATPEKVMRFMQKVKSSTKVQVWQRVFEIYKSQYAPLTGNYEGMSAEEIELYVFEEIMGDAFADTKNFGQDPTVWGSFADEVLIPEEAAQAGIISADEEIRDRTEDGKAERGPPAEGEQRFAVRRSGNRRMYQFPPYNESYSEANEIATRWAHRDDVEVRDKALVSYHNSWYLIEKFDSADWGYQIVERINKREYQTIRERISRKEENYGKRTDAGRKSISSDVDRFDNFDRQGNYAEGRKSGTDNLSVEYRGENTEVLSLDKEQAGSGEIAGNRDRNNERSIEDSGRQNVENPEPLSLPSLDDAPKDKQRYKVAEGEQRFAVRRSGNRRMYQFPPYNESYSEANELATRWAHRDDVEVRDKALVSYHNSWYLIEKFDSADLGYQIVERLNKQKYNEIIGDVKNERRTGKKQSIQERTDRDGSFDRRRNYAEGRKSGTDNLSVEYRGENTEVLSLDKEQAGSGEIAGNRDRNNERSIEDSGRQNVENPEPLSLPSLDDAPKGKQRYKVADEPEGLSLPRLEDVYKAEKNILGILSTLRNKQGIKYNNGSTIKIPKNDLEVLRHTYATEHTFSNRTDGILDCIACSGSKDTKHYLYVFYKGDDMRVAPVFRLDYRYIDNYINDVQEILKEVGHNDREIYERTEKIYSELEEFGYKGRSVSDDTNAFAGRRTAKRIGEVYSRENEEHRGNKQQHDSGISNGSDEGIFDRGNRVKYKISNDSLLGMKDKERSEYIDKLREKEARLRKQVKEQDERLFGGDATQDAGDKVADEPEGLSLPSLDDKNKYDYDNLVKKPDMEVTLLENDIPKKENGEIDRKQTAIKGIENARKKQNPKNTDERTFVYISDIEKDVLVTQDGLRHGLTRKPEVTAKVTLNIGDILQNAIKINELKAKKNSIGGYVLLGMGVDSKGNYYPTRVIVNNFSVDEVEVLDVIYAVNAKRRTSPQKRQGVVGNPTPLIKGSSSISIADLIDVVKDYFPDILPQSVLQHYEIYRPKSSLSNSVKYKISNDSLLEKRDKERSEYIDKLREKERRLRKKAEERDEIFFSEDTTAEDTGDAYNEWQETKKELEEALYGKRHGKEIPPEKMQVEEQDKAKQIIEERNKKENEAWDERKEHSSRETFKGSPALEKLGVKIENSATVYRLIPQKLANAQFLKNTKSKIDKLIKENGMTDFEIRMAKQYAGGEIEYDFLESRVLYEKEKAKRNGNSYRTPNLRMIEELAELYHIRDSLSETEPAKVRGRINEEIDGDMERIVSQSERYREELLKNQNNRYKENGKRIGEAEKAARNVGKFFWNQEMRYSSPARNMLSLFGEKVGEELNRELSYPVAENESENIRFKQRQNDELREVIDKNGKKRKLTREESALAQRVLEGESVRQSVKQNELKDAIIGAAKRLKAGDVPGDVFQEFNVLKNEEKELAHRYADWLETDELMKSGEFDGTIIRNAAEIAKEKYDQFFEAINEFFVAHGFEPIGYIKGYAPHFQPDETKKGIEGVFKKLGFSEEAVALSTQLAGRTRDFKPYKRWNPHFLQRKSNYTEYDLVKGYEQYVDYLGDILYHTDDVMRIRSLGRVLRTKFAPDNVRENIDRARAVLRMSAEEQIEFLKDVRALERDKKINASEARLLLEEYVEETVKDINLQGTKMNDVVVWIDNWANILAGKQALEDRSTEYTMGREALNSSNKINRAYARAAISGVVSSAVNQIAEIPVIYAELGTRYTAAAIRDMTIGAVNDPEVWKAFIEKSDYLTRKHGVKALVKSGYEKFVDGTFAPLNWVDEKLVSTLALRGKYLQELGKGKSERAALKIADRWVASVMSDYSKGSKPLAFQTKSALMQMINMFQQPILNSWQHIIRDLPYEIRKEARESGKKKAAKMLGAIILRLIPAAFLINRLADELYGATPAPFDPLGLVLTFMAGGERMTENEYLKKVIGECIGILTGTPAKDEEENRKREFDYEKATNAVIDAILEEIPFLRGITTVTGLSFSDYGRRSNSAIPGAQIVNDAASLVSSGKEALWGRESIWKVGEDLLSLMSKTFPVGNQLKKSFLGIMAYARGGFYNGYGEEKKLKFPVNDSLWSLFQLMLFGPYGTEESSEYYAKEYSALSVKQTELYNELSKAGADRESVYDGIQEFRSIDNDKELKPLQKHIFGNKVINAMELTDEQKLEVYRVLHTADSRAEKFKAMMETGLLFEKVTEAYEKHVEYNVQEDKDSSQKSVQFASWVDRQGYTKKQKEKIKDELMYWTQIAANADAYEKMVGNGLSPEEAEKISLEMLELEPLEGKKTVSETQRAAVIANSTDLSEKEKLLALEGYLDEDAYKKVDAVAKVGVEVSTYYDFRETLSKFDEDGNGNYKQKEVTEAVKSMSGLTNKEKAALWQSANSGWKGYKNPFDTSIGTKVFNSMNSKKESNKDSLALSLPSLEDATTQKKQKTEVPEWISLPRL